MKIRSLFVITLIALLSACSMIGGAKPIMPIEQGITFYTLPQSQPAPTVLMFTGCGGVETSAAHGDLFSRKAQWLNANGFNAVLVDYVKIMGVKSACYGQIKPDTLRKVAHEALNYTSVQPFVERDHIALLGWSMGASMALAVAQDLTVAQDLNAEAQPNISSVAAYYPGCFSGLQFSRFPTLLMLGLADNVAKASDCLALAEKSPQAPLQIKTYADAHHGFDVIELEQPKTVHFFWKTFTSAYNHDAADDAEKTLLNFLNKNNKENSRP